MKPIEKSLNKVESFNKALSRGDIRLKVKPLTNGRYSLFLAFWNTKTNKKEYKMLGLTLTGDASNDENALTEAKAEHSKETGFKRKCEALKEKYSLRKDEVKEADKTSGILFLDYYDKVFEEKKRRDNLQPNTCELYSTVYRTIKPFTENILLENITPELLLQIKENLAAKIKPSSLQTYFMKIKMILAEAARDGLLIKNPMDRIRFSTKEIEEDRKANIKYLTPDELQKIVTTKHPLYWEVQNVFIFSCYTGLRISDIEQLKFSNIDEETGTLKIKIQKTRNLISIKLNNTTLRILKEQREAGRTDRVFEMKGRSSSQMQLLKLSNFLGLRNLTYHMARHTFAVNSITNGVDLYTLSKMLGHTSLETTQIYAAVIDSKMADAIAKLPEY